MNNIISQYVFHPWEYLMEELSERWITQTSFANILWKPIKTINEIINWKKSITPEISYLFESALWISALTWLWLQKKYDLSKVKPKLQLKYKSIQKNYKMFINSNKKINKVLENQNI